MIEDDGRGSKRLAELLEFLDLALSELRTGLGALQALLKLTDDHRTGLFG